MRENTTESLPFSSFFDHDTTALLCKALFFALLITGDDPKIKGFTEHAAKVLSFGLNRERY